MSGTKSTPGFATTCWSEVRRAARIEGDAAEALEHLCGQYWYPLYAYLRSSGHDREAAQDHVQSFFADLLSRGTLQHADPQRGRFRTFLLTACRNHVVNRQRHQSAARRGGGRAVRSLDIAAGEVRYARERSHRWTAEKLFDRQWALTVIEAAFSRVRDAYQAKGRTERFDALRPLIAPAGAPPSQAEVAEQLGCSEGAVRIAAHRLRQQFSDALREEIAGTLELDPNNVGPQSEAERAIDDELKELLAALSDG
jgi:RNA polymerase sigma-70 factor (ECF subfamily)